MKHFDGVKYFYIALHIILGQYKSYILLNRNIMTQSLRNRYSDSFCMKHII